MDFDDMSKVILSLVIETWIFSNNIQYNSKKTFYLLFTITNVVILKMFYIRMFTKDYVLFINKLFLD